MHLGIIGRADHGGLAALTGEVARHLHPERVLVVDLVEHQRGSSTDPERFRPWCDQLFVSRYRRTDHEAEHFLDGLDVCWSAETMYDDRVYQIARKYGVKIVLHAMPELFGPKEHAADIVWNPTVWEQDRLPGRATYMPVPVATDLFVPRLRSKVETLFCTTGEAMADRNGTETVVGCLPHIERPCRLLVRGGPEPDPREFTVGKVDVEWLPPVESYEQTIPDEADVLLLPRRYGGLALPAQEAAAKGVLPLMSRLAPQTSWLPDDLLVAVSRVEPSDCQARWGTDGSMKGGMFPIYEVDPVAYATRINWLLDTPNRVIGLSHDVRWWAETLAWERQLPAWRDALDRAAG